MTSDPQMRRVIAWFVCFCVTVTCPAWSAIDLELDRVDRAGVAYQRFKAWVDAAVAGRPGYAFAATDAVWVYRIEGGGSDDLAYARLAIDLVEQQVAAAEAEIAAGRRPAISGDSYLEVGPMLRDLALVYDWCAPLLTASQRSRWAAYAEQAVWNVWHPAEARWGAGSHPWSGWSINDPGNNYHYSFLEATMYWALASNSTGWRSFLENQKFAPLTAFFAGLPGGGSREGTGYGLSHMRLFDLYRTWRASTGVDLSAGSTHTSDSIDYWIHATVPTMDAVAPIGDQARVSYPELFDYHRNVVLQAQALATDGSRRSRASWWLSRISVPRMGQGFNFRHDLLVPAAQDSAPTQRYYHGRGAGHAFARSDWTRDSWWVSMVAGTYDQSHAHQDQGAFTLYGGRFLSVTGNVWSHSGIQQGGEYHNVLRFRRGGVDLRQRERTTSRLELTETSDDTIEFNADLTPAYALDAGVQSWLRTLRFKPRSLRIEDQIRLGAGVDAVFQLQLPTPPAISGKTARSGDLLITVTEPANAVLSAVPLASEDTDFLSGWRLEVRGSSTGFVVELGDVAVLFGNGFE